ncbi:hypothetical protein LP420_00620 [Massilia sp. B-10]|nr:hypothetical protein LP420_00620 [Massilia sp. B-10]
MARFDGVRFTIYSPVTNPELPGVWTRSLMVDSGGRVWIGTYKGLAVFENGVFRTIAIADKAQYPALDINAIVEDEGRIVVGTTNGVFDVADGKLVRRAGSPAPNHLPAQERRRHLRRHHRRRGAPAWQRQRHAGPARSHAPGRGHAPGRSPGQDLGLSTSVGLMVRSGDTWEAATQDPILQHSPTNMLFQDSDRSLWVSSNA